MKGWRLYLTCSLLFGLSAGWMTALAGEFPEVRTFDESAWKDNVEDADFFRDRDKPEAGEGSPAVQERKGMREIGLGPLKYVLLVIVGAAIVFVLLRVFASELFKPSVKLAGSAEAHIFDLEEGLEDAPLQRMLKEYLANGDYRGAIRAYYLLVLQELNAGGWISWHREKTNRHYVREMQQHREAALFRAVTSAFERAWYGDQEAFERGDFEAVEPAFRRLLTAIDR